MRVHKKATKEVSNHSTIDFDLLKIEKMNSNLCATEIKLPYILGTTAKDDALPLDAFPTDENIIWSSEGEENKIALQTKSGARQASIDHTKYTAWPAKFDVVQNKTWKITFNISADVLLHIEDKIFVEDRHGNQVGQTVIISEENNKTTISIKPNKTYNKCETYTLYIQSLEGEYGEVLQQCVKMDFTIGGGEEGLKIPK